MPGADGPLATPHLEYLREGLEHCEARIFLEQALLDPGRRERLGDDLARRCQAALDERQAAMAMGMAHLQMDNPAVSAAQWLGGNELAGSLWFQGSPWQDRSARLFALAAEAAGKLEAN